MVCYIHAAAAILGFLTTCDFVAGSGGMKKVGKKKNKVDIDNMAYADCEEYCEKYGAVCGDLFFSKDGCMADCRMFPRTDVPPVYDLSFDPIDLGSDTFNCRATHLSFAIEFGGGGNVYQARKSPDAAFHCGHASPGGEGICTDYKSNEGLNNPFRLMQSGGNFKFGVCRVTTDKKVANCMRSDLTDDSVVGALKVLPSSTEHLFLHRNNLTHVPEDIADMFPNLKSLYLDGNFIASVSPKDFDGLDELEILSFNENPVTVLHEHLLQGTPNLKTFSFFLGVSGITTITKIPKHFFQHTKGIVNIIMYGHKGLTKFDVDVFRGLTECKIISFVDCNFTWEGFPKGLFNDLVSLEFFDFFINNFTGPIPGDLFGPWAKNVFRAVFWGNPGIDGIEEGAFDNLKNVKKIFLHWTGVSADDVAGVHMPSTVEVLTLP